MASKRLKNRIHWARVRAGAHHPGSPLASRLRDAYMDVFTYDMPDREVMIFHGTELDALAAEVAGEAGP